MPLGGTTSFNKDLLPPHKTSEKDDYTDSASDSSQDTEYECKNDITDLIRSIDLTQLNLIGDAKPIEIRLLLDFTT